MRRSSLIEILETALSLFKSVPQIYKYTLNDKICFLEVPRDRSLKSLQNFICKIIALNTHSVTIILIDGDLFKKKDLEKIAAALPSSSLWTQSEDQAISFVKSPVKPFTNASLGFFSSGSSGAPKLIFHREDSLIQSATHSGEILDLSDKTLLSSLPFNHVGGFLNIFRSGIFKCPFIWKTSMDLFNNIPNQSVIVGVPAQITFLTEIKGLTFYAGGDKVSKKDWERADQLGIHLISTYGQTESAGAILYQMGPLKETKVFSDVEIKVGDDATLQYRTSRLSTGFLSAGHFNKFDSKKFFKTNDLIEISQNGQISFLGRKDLNFQCGGEMISPVTIEERLKIFLIDNKLPQIDFKIIGIKDERLGSVPVAFIRNREDIEGLLPLLRTLEKGPSRLRFLSITPDTLGIKPSMDDYERAFKTSHWAI